MVGTRNTGESSITSQLGSAPKDTFSLEYAEIERKIADLEGQFQELSATIDSPGITEAKKFATKKNLAKLRANILRLKREKDSSSSNVSRR